MRSYVVLVLLSLLSAPVFAATNTDTTTFLADSREVSSYKDQHGTTYNNIPSPAKFDVGQYFYTQTITQGDFFWSCKEYDGQGICLDLARKPRPPVEIISFVHDRNAHSQIQADLIGLYNAEHERKIQIINLSEDRSARVKYDIHTLPVIIIRRGDKEIARKTGLETRTNMSNWLKHELSK